MIWQPLFAIAAALLPGVVFIVLLLQLGRRRFVPDLLATSLTLGAISGLVPAYIGILSKAAEKAGILHLSPFAVAFVAAGCLEEATKAFVIYFLIRPHYLRRSDQDLVLAGAGVGLGFALLENIFYVAASGAAWEGLALVRAALTVPMHALLGLLIGYGFVRFGHASTRTRGAIWIIGTWLAVVCLHGFYDYPIFALRLNPFYAPVVLHAAALLQISPPVFLQGFVAVTIVAIVVLACIVLHRTSVPDGVEPAAIRDVTSRRQFLEELVFERSAFWLSIAVGILGLSCACLALELLWRGASFRVVLELVTLTVFPLFTAALFTGTTTRSSRPDWAISLSPFAPRSAGLCAAAVLTSVLFALTPAFDGVLSKLQLESGLERIRSGASRDSLSDFDDVLARDPHNEAALFSRAIAHDLRNEDELSLADARELRALRPDNVNVIALEAQLLVKLRHISEARSSLDEALTSRPDDATLLLARANLMSSSGDAQAARALFQRVLAIRPDDLDALTDLADVDFQAGDYTTAQSEIDRALRKSPASAKALFLRGRVRFSLRRYQEAVGDFRQALAMGEGPYAALWLFLAESFAGQGGQNELAFWASTTSRDVWPFPLFQLYLGARSMPMTAKEATNENAQCEFAFYVGEWLRLQHFNQQSETALQTAARICPADFVEKAAAIAELRALAPGPSTPVPPVAAAVRARAPSIQPPVSSAVSSAPSLLIGADRQYSAVTTWATNKARPDVGITPAFSSTTKFFDARRSVTFGIRELLYPGHNDEFLVTIAASLMPNSRESQTDPLNGLSVNGSPSILDGDRRETWPTMKVVAQEQSISFDALERLVDELETADSLDIPLRSKTGATFVATIRLTQEARTALTAFRQSIDETSAQVADMRKVAEQNANESARLP